MNEYRPPQEPLTAQDIAVMADMMDHTNRSPVKPKGPRRRTHSMSTEAPIIRVRYECPECGWLCVLNPYDGPPTCANDHPSTWMEAVALIRTSDPTADIDAKRTEPRGLAP